MKTISLILLLTFSFLLKEKAPIETFMGPISEAYLIMPGSKLTIVGSTNINDFECKFDIAELTEPVVIDYNENNQVLKFSKAALKLRNKSFDCGSRPINKDFLSLLKTENYPEITLKLKEIFWKNDPTKVNAVAEIEIAGIRKTYNVNVKASNENNLVVSGLLKLNIEDFNLKAPKKVLGLIVVEKIIDIKFILNLSPYG
ncbi:YceI family protein [Aegicerativicinus sediminis]